MSVISDFGEGIIRALIEVVVSIVALAVFGALVSSGQVTGYYFLLAGFVAALPTIALLADMRVWSVAYTIGWFLGVGLMWHANLLQWYELVLFLGVPSAIIAIKIWLHFND